MVEQRRVVHGSPSVQMLQGADRLLLVAEGEDGVPTLQHLIVPSTYMATNWPVRHVAVAPTGQDIAVAGKRGITLYNTASRKWRVFGDIRQERQVAATALLWLPKIIGVCNELSGGKHELLFYPRYHLDNQSLLLRHPLPGGAPLALDSQGDILLEAAAPFDVRIYRAVVVGELSPLKSPTLRLQPLRELSTMSYRRPPLCLALVPSLACTPSNADGAASSAPTRCMVLRVGGELSILDLAAGSEQTLSNGVENFWLTLPKHGSGKAARSDASNASQSNGAQSKTANGSAGATPSPSDGVKHLRTLLVSDWGPSQEDTGGVSSLAWSPDEKALAVGWSARGMAVWSASGCRLMCTIRQGKGGTASHGDWHSSLPSPTLTPLSLHSAAGPKQLEALRTGVAGLCWDHHGYSLIAAENGSARRLVQFTMAK
eukprot:gene31450-39555_t